MYLFSIFSFLIVILINRFLSRAVLGLQKNWVETTDSSHVSPGPHLPIVSPIISILGLNFILF